MKLTNNIYNTNTGMATGPLGHGLHWLQSTRHDR